jgi:hypothetical protein
MNFCYRTQTSKLTSYLPNGDGRDGYIYSNNGGIAKYTYPFGFKEESRIARKTRTSFSPQLDPKALKYKSNGTGRDSYIGFNHGGLVSSYEKHSFYRSLRQRSPNLTPKLLKTQSYLQYIKNQKEAVYQKQTSLRLSEPKWKKQ